MTLERYTELREQEFRQTEQAQLKLAAGPTATARLLDHKVEQMRRSLAILRRAK